VIRIEPFRMAHLDAFAPGEWDRAAMARSDFATLAPGWDGHDMGCSAIMNGRVLAIGGIAVTEGEGLAWIFASDELRAMPVLMHRTTKRLLGLVFAHWKLKRIIAEVPEGFAACHRWVGKLGFSQIQKNEAFTTYELRA
jgi:hypothetical protein